MRFKYGDSDVETIKVERKFDNINQPSHYNSGKIEVIEIIEELASKYNDGYVAYCLGNTEKYIHRAPFKHESPLEDLKKAAVYLNYAIEHIAKNESDS